MVKRVLKRQFALLICFMVAFTMLLPSWVFSVDLAYAATLQTEIDGLTASYDAGTWTASGNTLNGSATGKAKGQCDDASAETSTLTLKNTSGATALLAFDYAKPTLGSGGSVTIDGTARTAAGSFTKELANNESVTVVILSGNAGAYTSSIELTNVKIVPVRQVTTTFAPPQAHGSIAVGGTQITDTAAYTRNSTEAYELKATPDAGYKLMGWYGSVDGYFSTSETLTTYFSSDQTITAVFIDKNAPVFEVGDEWFTDLNEAHAYAVSSGISKIVLMADGTLPAGNYTIGAGKTLLIPYENSYIVSTTKPGTYRSVTPTAPSKYRQLTVASGANITVNGAICVNAKVNSYNNAYTGATSGKYGYLYLNPGSSVTLNSGANLYCWGYIAGKGEITAKSGAKVYEPFEIADIRGGTATSGMNGNSQKVMPFSQYYVQNIESPLTLEYGASETAAGNITIQSTDATPTVEYLGTGSSSMFRLTSGGSFKKTYDPSEDRVTYEINGDASLNSVTMSAYINVNTANYTLPIMENTTIIVHSGTTTINQDFCMIPGSQVIVDSGASVVLASGKNAYVYDRDEWIGNKFIYSSTDMKTSYYQPDRANADKFTTADMVDARIDLNGTADIKGKLYTTSGGADITSSGKTGQMKFSVAPTETGTTYQAVQSGTDITYTSIALNAPWLHNGIDLPEYTTTAGKTAAGESFYYCEAHDIWEHQNDGPHKIAYELTGWNWADDHSSATAVFAMNTDPTKTKEIPAVVTTETVAATCTEDGSVTYTATATYDGETYTDVQTTVLSAFGHSWAEPTYEWSTDNKQATASRVCNNDASHVQSETVDTTSEVTKKPTCTEKGETTYTAAFNNKAFVAQVKTVANIDALGHDWDDGTVTTEPTCTEPGEKTFTCKNDSAHKRTETIDPLGHAWEDPTYEWSADNKQATAQRVCKNDPKHVESETVDTTSEMTKKPTCEEKGETTYTAAFTNKAFGAQTKTLANIDALGHDWAEPTYEWSADNASVTASVICDRDSSHKIVEKKETVKEVLGEATCEQAGTIRYSVTFENDFFKPQSKEITVDAIGHDWDDGTMTTEPTCTEPGEKTFTCKNDSTHKRTETIDPLGHAWENPTYEWSSDNKRATAQRVCKNDPKHVESETVDTTSEVTKKPTCEEKGETTYTAAFTNKVFVAQTKTLANIDALGHDWAEPTYEWSADNASVTASVICDRDNTHKVVEEKATEKEVLGEATCEEPGSIRFTVAFENDLFKPQSKEITVDAIGHAWEDPTYEWSADNKQATAQRVCKNDPKHVESETVDTTSEMTKKPTCEEKGETTYTAAFTNKAFIAQTKTIANIDALGHDWDDGTVTTEPTCTDAGEKTFTCRNDSAHTRTEVIDALGHDWSDWEALDDNDHQRVCAHDASHTEIASHEWDSGVTTKEATVEEEGEVVYTCAVCGHTRTEAIPKLDPEPVDPDDGMGEDGTPLGPGASADAADAAITGMTDDTDPPGSQIAPLLLRSTKQGNKSIRLTWQKQDTAAVYVLYGNQCGRKNKMKKIKTISGSKGSFTVKKAVKKLRKGKSYKFILVALDSDNKVVSASKMIHVVTKGGKKGNFKSVKTRAKKNRVTLTAGQTFRLNAKGVLQSKKRKAGNHVKMRYQSIAPEIADVSSKGVIQATAPGTGYVYVYAQNGVFKKITITVTE